jgi:Icc-related predicted phosphoesterase
VKTLVVGDIHEKWDVLNKLIEDQQPDIILQCGDFGCWQLNSTINQLNTRNTKIYWCDGNHEDHHFLRHGEEREINSVPGVWYMPRGSVIKLPDGRTVMFVGGAESADKADRKPMIDWFPEETISYADVERCLAYDGQIDIIVSHTCPSEFNPRYISGSGDMLSDPSRKALSVILQHFKPKQWFFGHFHIYQERMIDGTHFVGLDCTDHTDIWWMSLPEKQ